MKKILTILAIALSLTAKSQNYTFDSVSIYHGDYHELLTPDADSFFVYKSHDKYFVRVPFLKDYMKFPILMLDSMVAYDEVTNLGPAYYGQSNEFRLLPDIHKAFYKDMTGHGIFLFFYNVRSYRPKNYQKYSLYQ